MLKRKIGICVRCNKEYKYYPNDRPTAQFCSHFCSRLKLGQYDWAIKGITWNTANLEQKNLVLKLAFEKFVIKKDKCWDWKGSKRNGYGKLTFNGKNMEAHRISYIIHKGEIPIRKNVLHLCDNPPCTNPDHLFLGTHRDNMKDMAAKNRNNFNPVKGENHTFSKLKTEQVLEIQQLLKNGITQKELAKKYNVNQVTISDIKRKITWKHLGV